MRSRRRKKIYISINVKAAAGNTTKVLFSTT